MSEEELLALASDRPVPWQHNAAAHYYGMGKWLKRYAGFPNYLPLCVATDHAPTLADAPAPRDLETSAPFFLFHGSRLIDQWRNLTDVPCGVMGSPFVHFRRLQGIRQRANARGTIAYPFHGTHNIKLEMDWEEYAYSLRRLPAKYQPVTVCMYWADVLRGAHRPFMSAGLPVVTAGHMYDERFVERFYDFLSRHRFATSNGIQSATFYAVEMGIPFFLYGQNLPVSAHNNSDPNVPTGTWDPIRHFATRRYANELFAELSDRITSEQKAFVDQQLGLKDSMTRGQLGRVLWGSFFIHRFRLWKKQMLDIMLALANASGTGTLARQVKRWVTNRSRSTE